MPWLATAHVGPLSSVARTTDAGPLTKPFLRPGPDTMTVPCFGSRLSQRTWQERQSHRTRSGSS